MKPTKLYEHNGESKTLRQWAEAYGLPESTLYARITQYGFSNLRGIDGTEGEAGRLYRHAKPSNSKQEKPTMKSKKAVNQLRPVLVTTANRGVFFGFADATDGETINLKDARLCVYWSADVKGFMGLASAGPSKGCRIGPPADITLRNITAVVEVKPEAVKAWENAPWS